ncbi:alpha/beta hydrolase, partial [Francisella tularensis subsp. holarctica]|nr:alpha/beta hydrolase [Francisella tularensis subsp. holarctica]
MYTFFIQGQAGRIETSYDKFKGANKDLLAV